MKTSFEDIKNLTNKEPVWYDKHGCPRFCEFSPKLVPNVYATCALLMKISCQRCGKIFKVSLNYGAGATPFESLKRYKDKRSKGRLFPVQYCDPPNHDCPTGNVMSSNSKEILEFWMKENGNWVRHSEVELIVEE